MKKSISLLLFSLLITVVSTTSIAQIAPIVNQTNWDSPVVWHNSSTPTIKRYGDQSDSLRAVYEVDFLFHNGLYYHVNSWADYFLWFTQRYSYRFNLNVALYKYYYDAKDNWAMMDFVFNTYRGGIFPTITVQQVGKTRTYVFDAEKFEKEDEKLSRTYSNPTVDITKPKPVTFSTHLNTTNQSISGSKTSSNKPSKGLNTGGSKKSQKSPTISRRKAQ